MGFQCIGKGRSATGECLELALPAPSLRSAPRLLPFAEGFASSVRRRGVRAGRGCRPRQRGAKAKRMRGRSGLALSGGGPWSTPKLPGPPSDALAGGVSRVAGGAPVDRRSAGQRGSGTTCGVGSSWRVHHEVGGVVALVSSADVAHGRGDRRGGAGHWLSTRRPPAGPGPRSSASWIALVEVDRLPTVAPTEFALTFSGMDGSDMARTVPETRPAAKSPVELCGAGAGDHRKPWHDKSSRV